MVSAPVRRQYERLLNLIVALRNTRTWMSKAQIREHVEGYENLSDDAFNRMFERDKATLRGMGINISSTDWGNRPKEDVVYGDRITDEDYALDEISFTPAEVEVLRAASVWLPQTGPAVRAMTKLTGLGEDLIQHDVPVPATATNTKLTGRFIDAVEDRRPQAFTYRKAGGQPEVRTLFPYGVLSRGPRVYVVGYDVDREGIRVFRLSRIVGKVKHHPKYRSSAYDIPSDFSASDYVRSDPTVRVSVALVHGRGDNLRSRAHAVSRIDDSWDRVTVDVTDMHEFVSEMLSLGSFVTPLEPPEVVRAYEDGYRQTVDRLKELARE